MSAQSLTSVTWVIFIKRRDSHWPRELQFSGTNYGGLMLCYFLSPWITFYMQCNCHRPIVNYFMNILKDYDLDFSCAIWNNYAAEVAHYDSWLLKWSSLVLKIRSIVAIPFWFLSYWWFLFLSDCKKPSVPLTKKYFQLAIARDDT